MVIDKICKMTVKGVKPKSESFFSISHGVLEYGGKTLGGGFRPPPAWILLNNYPWTRLSVRMIRVIKRQFFRMVTHVFDNSNLSEETFVIETWGAVICSLGHGRMHLLRSFRLYGDQA